MGFHEPKHSSTNRSIAKIIEDLDHAIQKNYWPILRDGLPNNVKLNVKIEHFVNGTIQKNNSRLINDITKKDFENFSKALINQNNQKNVSAALSSTIVKIPFQIPERVKSGRGIAKHKSFKTELELCIYRSDLTMMHSKFKNMCAFIRGFGMVVKYETTKRKPIDPLPFFAVLKVGNAKSDSEADLNDAEEDFFRLIEPELHNDWVTTDNYQQNYDKTISPNTLIEKLKHDISEKIYELCGFEISENKNGPQPLSKKLAIGKGSSGKKERDGYKIFSENLIQIPTTEGKYDISFDIKRKEGIIGPINVKVDYMLNSESGETKKIPFVELNVSNSDRIIEFDKQQIIRLDLFCQQIWIKYR